MWNLDSNFVSVSHCIGLIIGLLFTVTLIAFPTRKVSHIITIFGLFFVSPYLSTIALAWTESDFFTFGQIRPELAELCLSFIISFFIALIVFHRFLFSPLKNEYYSALNIKLDFLNYIIKGHANIRDDIEFASKKNHRLELELDKIKEDLIQSKAEQVELKKQLEAIVSDHLDIELHRAHSKFKDDTDTRISLVGESNVNSALIDKYSGAYAHAVLHSFIKIFSLSIESTRFTLRALDPRCLKMVSIVTVQDDNGRTPGDIDLNHRNLITESMVKEKPLLYSDNKDFHFDTKNNSLKNGNYDEYLTYSLKNIYVIENREYPLFSICIDVRGSDDAMKLRKIIDNDYVESLYIALEPHLEYQKDRLFGDDSWASGI